MKNFSSEMQNSFVRLAILDWNELPSENQTKQKSSPGCLKFSSAQFLTLVCGKLLVQQGVTLNLEI